MEAIALLIHECDVEVICVSRIIGLIYKHLTINKAVLAISSVELATLNHKVFVSCTVLHLGKDRVVGAVTHEHDAELILLILVCKSNCEVVIRKVNLR